MEVTLGALESIPEGEGRAFQIGPERIAIFRTRQGRIFASQAECPHRSGPLADGLLGGTTLICPLHAMKFDLNTGLASNGDCALKMYAARLSDTGNIIVDITGERKADGK